MEAHTSPIKANLTEGPIGKTLLKLTNPMVLGLMAIISLNLVDTFFIAKLGKDQLAAMSFSLPVVMLLMNALLGQAVGTGSVISRAIGRGDHVATSVGTTSSLFFSFFLLLLTAALGIISIDPLFSLFNVSAPILVYIHSYMWIWYLGLPAMGLAIVGNAAITAAGDVFLPSLIMIIAALLNLILDPILIFGLLGFPRLEMEGAGLATVISYCVAFCICFWGVVWQKKMVTLPFNLKSMWAAWKEIFKISLPAGASQMIVPITSAITVWMLSGFGAGVVGAYGIVARLEAFVLIVIIGLCNCIGPFVGQNWGAKKLERAHQSVAFGYKFSLIWGVAIAICLALGARAIPQLFSSDSTVISTVSLYLLTVPISYGAVGCIFVTNAFLNAIGHSFSVALITFVRYFILYVPIALYASHKYGPFGIFITISLVNITMGISVYLYMRNFSTADRETTL